MRPARTVLIVAGAAVALVALRSCRHDDHANHGSQPTTHHAQRAIGPTGEAAGVPDGWRHDPDGARAAAIAFVALTGDVAHAGPIARHDMILRLASNRYGPALADTTDHQINDLLDSLGQADIDPSQLVWLETPLTARLLPGATPTTVRAAVWSALVLGVPDIGAPRQAWRTITVTLVWEHGDWKVDDWAARAGPTPALGPETPISDLHHLRGPAGWPPALRKDA